LSWQLLFWLMGVNIGIIWMVGTPAAGTVACGGYRLPAAGTGACGGYRLPAAGTGCLRRVQSPAAGTVRRFDGSTVERSRD